MSVNTSKVQVNPAATASQGGGQAAGLPVPTNLPPVPALADVAAVQAYLVQLVAALQP